MGNTFLEFDGLVSKRDAKNFAKDYLELSNSSSFDDAAKEKFLNTWLSNVISERDKNRKDSGNLLDEPSKDVYAALKALNAELHNLSDDKQQKFSAVTNFLDAEIKKVKENVLDDYGNFPLIRKEFEDRGLVFSSGEERDEGLSGKGKGILVLPYNKLTEDQKTRFASESVFDDFQRDRGIPGAGIPQKMGPNSYDVLPSDSYSRVDSPESAYKDLLSEYHRKIRGAIEVNLKFEELEADPKSRRNLDKLSKEIEEYNNDNTVGTEKIKRIAGELGLVVQQDRIDRYLHILANKEDGIGGKIDLGQFSDFELNRQKVQSGVNKLTKVQVLEVNESKLLDAADVSLKNNSVNNNVSGGEEGLFNKIKEDLKKDGFSKEDYAAMKKLAEYFGRNHVTGGIEMNGRDKKEIKNITHYSDEKLKEILSTEMGGRE